MTTQCGRWTVALDGKSLPDKALVGGKAWSIAWMRSLDMPVPPAFVVTTEACHAYLESGEIPDGLSEEIAQGISWLESVTGCKLGSAHDPLLLSVRSGAPVSMPGMMDTVLNLGIDSVTEQALSVATGDPKFARDTHRRFYELYTSIVLKLSHGTFDDQGPDTWNSEIAAMGGHMPERIQDRLNAAICAVFNSWNSRRAKRYREHHDIPNDLGTAVTIQAMVFGNRNEKSGTGVLFTRNPLSGAKEPFGEYLPCAQGEDVVSGKFTPKPLSTMRDVVPAAHAALLTAAERLEQANRDVQDIEFTVESGKLYFLQVRPAKRAPEAAVQIAVDMVAEGLIDSKTALSRVNAQQVRTLLLPRLDDRTVAGAEIVAKGEGACPGVATGIVVTDPSEAEQRAAKGEAVILARRTTSPDDVHGMIAARGVITEQGGATSHAAVVSRALGRPCIVGTGDGVTAMAGRTVTVDGASGLIFNGMLDVIVNDERQDPRLVKLIEWARQETPITVCAPGDEPDNQSILDLDAIDGVSSAEQIAKALADVKAVRGALLFDDAAIRVAAAQGVELIVTSPVLPALLTVLEMRL